LELRFASTTQISQRQFNPVNTSSLQTRLFTKEKITIASEVMLKKNQITSDIPILVEVKIPAANAILQA
jgi:hypothetical protein